MTAYDELLAQLKKGRVQRLTRTPDIFAEAERYAREFGGDGEPCFVWYGAEGTNACLNRGGSGFEFERLSTPHQALALLTLVEMVRDTLQQRVPDWPQQLVDYGVVDEDGDVPAPPYLQWGVDDTVTGLHSIVEGETVPQETFQELTDRLAVMGEVAMGTLPPYTDRVFDIIASAPLALYPTDELPANHILSALTRWGAEVFTGRTDEPSILALLTTWIGRFLTRAASRGGPYRDEVEWYRTTGSRREYQEIRAALAPRASTVGPLDIPATAAYYQERFDVPGFCWHGVQYCTGRRGRDVLDFGAMPFELQALALLTLMEMGITTLDRRRPAWHNEIYTSLESPTLYDNEELGDHLYERVHLIERAVNGSITADVLRGEVNRPGSALNETSDYFSAAALAVVDTHVTPQWDRLWNRADAALLDILSFAPYVLTETVWQNRTLDEVTRAAVQMWPKARPDQVLTAWIGRFLERVPSRGAPYERVDWVQTTGNRGVAYESLREQLEGAPQRVATDLPDIRKEAERYRQQFGAYPRWTESTPGYELPPEPVPWVLSFHVLTPAAQAVAILTLVEMVLPLAYEVHAPDDFIQEILQALREAARGEDWPGDNRGWPEEGVTPVGYSRLEEIGMALQETALGPLNAPYRAPDPDFVREVREDWRNVIYLLSDVAFWLAQPSDELHLESDTTWWFVHEAVLEIFDPSQSQAVESLVEAVWVGRFLNRFPVREGVDAPMDWRTIGARYEYPIPSSRCVDPSARHLPAVPDEDLPPLELRDTLRREFETLSWHGAGHAFLVLWDFLFPYLQTWLQATPERHTRYYLDRYAPLFAQMSTGFRIMRETGSFHGPSIAMSGFLDRVVLDFDQGPVDNILADFEEGEREDVLVARALVAGHVMLTMSHLMDEGEGQPGIGDLDFVRERVWDLYFRTAVGMRAVSCAVSGMLDPLPDWAEGNWVPEDYDQSRSMFVQADEYLDADLDGVRCPQTIWRTLWRLYAGSRPFRGTLGTVGASEVSNEIPRHRTAMKRRALSRPARTAIEDGIIDTDTTVLDYGSGRGDDVKRLLDQDIEARGWDPHYAPDGDDAPADIVLHSYVANVIEDPKEREEALKDAWKRAEDTLVLAVRSPSEIKCKTPHGDGCLTSIGTFQRGWTDDELLEWAQDVLPEAHVERAAKGIIYAHRAEPESDPEAGKTTGARPVAVFAAPGTLFHVQFQESDSPPTSYFVATPGIPTRAMPGENRVTPRVSLAPSPEEAWLGMEPMMISPEQVANYGYFGTPTDAAGFEVRIYTNAGPVQAFQPSEDEVPDINFTNEIWALAPVPLRLVAREDAQEHIVAFNDLVHQIRASDGIYDLMGMQEDREDLLETLRIGGLQ